MSSELFIDYLPDDRLHFGADLFFERDGEAFPDAHGLLSRPATLVQAGIRPQRDEHVDAWLGSDVAHDLLDVVAVGGIVEDAAPVDAALCGAVAFQIEA